MSRSLMAASAKVAPWYDFINFCVGELVYIVGPTEWIVLMGIPRRPNKFSCTINLFPIYIPLLKLQP